MLPNFDTRKGQFLSRFRLTIFDMAVSKIRMLGLDHMQGCILNLSGDYYGNWSIGYNIIVL